MLHLMWKSYINTPSILPGNEEKQTTQFALQATLPNYDIISLIKFFFECLSKHPQVYRKGISVFSHSGHLPQWSSIVFSVCFCVDSLFVVLFALREFKIQNQNTKCNQIRKRNEVRWSKSKTIAQTRSNRFEPLLTDCLLSLSLYLSFCSMQ